MFVLSYRHRRRLVPRFRLIRVLPGEFSMWEPNGAQRPTRCNVGPAELKVGGDRTRRCGIRTECSGGQGRLARVLRITEKVASLHCWPFKMDLYFLCLTERHCRMYFQFLSLRSSHLRLFLRPLWKLRWKRPGCSHPSCSNRFRIIVYF